MLSQNHIESIRQFFSDKPVLKVWLFGSTVRNEENENSDVDILVRLDYSKKIGWDYFGYKPKLEDLLGKKVDLVSEPFLKDFARDSVEKDRLLIYGK